MEGDAFQLVRNAVYKYHVFAGCRRVAKSVSNIKSDHAIVYNAVSCAKESFRFRGIDAGEAAYPGRTFSAEESAAIRAELKAAGVTGL